MKNKDTDKMTASRARKPSIKEAPQILKELINEAERGEFWKPITSYASVLFIMKQRYNSDISLSTLKAKFKEEVEILKELYQGYFEEQIISGDPKLTRNMLEMWKTTQAHQFGAKITNLQKEVERLQNTSTSQYTMKIEIADEPMKRFNDINNGENNE